MIAIGDPAPNFSLPSSESRAISLKDFRGQFLVLYFYPEDDTPGCTIQACGLRDEYAAYKKADIAVLGISPDLVDSHIRFKQKFSLPFPLLVDEGHKIANQYGVWAEKINFGKKYMGLLRNTYLIDPSGKIAAIFPRVRVKGHAQRILAAALKARKSFADSDK